MKKLLVPILCACVLLLGASACKHNNEPDFKKVDYLKLAHGTVGQPYAKAEKNLTDKGFTAADEPAEDGSRDYVLANSDSSNLVVITLAAGDTVKSFSLGVELRGDNKYKQAKQLYTQWSDQAYNTLFADITWWNGMLNSSLSDQLLFTDGAMATIVKSFLDLAYAMGQIEAETYQLIAKAFEKKRTDFNGNKDSSDFLRDGQVYEIFAHATSPLDMANIASNWQSFLSGLRGNVGYLSANVSAGVWTLSFSYSADQSMPELDMLSDLNLF